MLLQIKIEYIYSEHTVLLVDLRVRSWINRHSQFVHGPTIKTYTQKNKVSQGMNKKKPIRIKTLLWRLTYPKGYVY